MSKDASKDGEEAWLATVYGAQDSREVELAYDGWASAYDADLASFGYTNFIYAAGLLSRFCTPGGGEILDAGCGTGGLGPHLAVLGYDELVGIDLSRGMLSVARGRGCYRELAIANLGQKLDFADNRFHGCVSFGVMTAGHGPPSALDELIRVTAPGGHLIFSVSKPAYEGSGFKQKLAELDASGRAKAAFKTPEYCPMPNSRTEADLAAHAYVYEIT